MKRSGPMNYRQLEKHISEQFLQKRRRLAGTMEVGTSSSSTPVAKGEQGHYKSQDEGVFDRKQNRTDESTTSGW